MCDFSCVYTPDFLRPSQATKLEYLNKSKCYFLPCTKGVKIPFNGRHKPLIRAANPFLVIASPFLLGLKKVVMIFPGWALAEFGS